MELRDEVLNVAESPLVVIATIAESLPDSLKLCYGESDLPTPAFIADALDRATRAGHTLYTHTAGCGELRQAISNHVFNLHAVRYDVSEIMVGVGASLGIFAAIRACLGTGDNAVVVSPAYAIYTNAAIMCGAEPRSVPLSLQGDRFVLDIDRVRAAVDSNTRMLIVNSPSNPTGWVISEDEQRALLELAEQHDLTILADEVYERLIYDGRAVAPSFARFATHRERIIVANSFSKTYNMTGWRLGWTQGSAPVIKAMYTAAEFMTSSPPAMIQQAGIVALRDGEPSIAALREHYRQRRDQVKRALAQLPGVTLPEPQGSFFAFPKLRNAPDSSAFTAALLRDTGLALAPGAAFGRDGEGYIRICFASTEDTVGRAMEKLKHFLLRSR